MADSDGAQVDSIARRGGRTWHGSRYDSIPTKEVPINDVTPGMVTTPPREKRPGGSALLARNARCRDYWCGRRPGTSEYIPKPDSNRVLKVLTAFLPGKDEQYLIRVTNNDIHVSRSLDGWQALSGSGLLGESRIVATQFYDLVLLATAWTKVIKIDLRTNSYEEIESAPHAKFITSFADRAIAAHVLPESVGGVRIQWSANGDPTEWDPLVDETAGQEDLIASPGDSGDEITGVHALTTEMLILRERSVWIASRQPIAFAPLRFQPLSTNHGCDLPYTAVKVENGVVWADYRSKGVWLFQPGTAPQRISEQIDNELYEDLQNFRWAEGSYDPFNREYHLGLATSTEEDITKVWVYNFKTRAWTFDDGPVITTIGQAVELNDLVMIDELVGVIDLLAGDIDDLSGENVVRHSVFKGTSTGEVIAQNYVYDHDWNEALFEFEWQSQNMGSFHRRRTIQDLMLIIEAPEDGTATLQESKNEVDWVNDKLVTITGSESEQRIGLPRRQITGNELYWRISTDTPRLRVLSWWVRILEKGLQRQQT